ncbi:hypothetical protein B0H14DRAFT_2901702 [Mycena olivaceomarginata]|nr:hypothetical protein B0H14DRAFT_2901702 [Mycena olivaceomarginata]
MLCAEGEARPYSRTYLPSPSSSPENVSSPVAAPRPAPSRVVESTSRRVKLQLHTPASSVDISPLPTSARNTVPAPPRAPDDSSSITGLLDQILASRASDELTVPRKIWLELSEEVPEDLGARLSYSADTEKLILTWPTEVHESFKWTIKPLLAAAEHDPRFVWETNTPVPFRSGPHTGSTLTPDFAALSQSSKDLNETAAKHLTRPEVACVIGLEFTTPTFLYPKPSPTPLKRLSFSDFKARATVSLLGGVEFERFKWAPPIQRIEMTIWFKKQGTNISPIENDTPNSHLGQYHTEILTLIRRITRAVLTPPIFNLLYPVKDSFAINWEGFYDDLHDRLLLDAYRRWYIGPSKDPRRCHLQMNRMSRSMSCLARISSDGQRNFYPDSDDEGEDVGRGHWWKHQACAKEVEEGRL